ncbi:chromate transporter [Methylocella silvestris]|nr:chromate transporter [Methylocella silvestris]
MAFFKIGLYGFGGVAGWVRPILVEERGWLSDREFAELHGAASVIPGANTVNLAVMLGDRFQGPAGSIAALCGLLLAPLAILIALASLFDSFGELPAVKGALSGAAAATAGLVIGNAYKLLRALNGEMLALVVAGATFASVGLLHFSFADDAAAGRSRQPRAVCGRPPPAPMSAARL